MSNRDDGETATEVADLPAFNLLNEVDVDETEAQIASYRRLHATSIAANQSALAIEAMSATEKDELDKRIREERMRMVEAAQRTERIEDEKVRIQIVDALAKGPEGARRAQEIRSKYEEAKAARNAALAKAISAGAASQGEEGKEENTTDPLGMDYTGPWVEIPYSNPDELEYKKWAQVRADYVDARSIVRWVKEDGGRNVRGGGWDLELFWQGEVEAAVMSLGVQPLV
jgi:CDK-activating kinase assembly factor MAT1